MGHRKNKSQAKHFTPEQIAQLEANPNVKRVTENRLDLTFEFRTKLYDEWMSSGKSMQSLLREGGINSRLVGNDFVQMLKKTFRKHGRPTNGKYGNTAEKYRRKNTEDELCQLLETGLFVKGAKGRGITFTDDFKKELYSHYPEKSIEAQLEEHGLDPVIVGYHRIYQLERMFRSPAGIITHHSDVYSPTAISHLQFHPYVSSISAKQLYLSDAFYTQAYPLRQRNITEILTAFEIDPADIPFSVLNNINHKLQHWGDQEHDLISVAGDPEQLLRIQKNINRLLQETVDQNTKLLPQNMARVPMRSRKAVCEIIRDVYHSSHGLYRLKDLLNGFHISEDLYYNALSNHYLDNEIKREKRDEQGIRQIRVTLEASKYPMGSRMLYMKFMHSKKTKMGRDKILRLMRKAGISTAVRRKATQDQLAARKELLSHVKPNLLSRRFRLGRPMTIILTDVTYLICGEKTFYMSAVKDAVTGKILAVIVSENNDLSMAMDTLKALQKYHFHARAVFHSDQGVLYLTSEFQNELKKMGFIQSMSRRGCCWDNASQESFFGHFKDEVDYESCTTIDEARELVNEYVSYYNFDRPQWTRNKMTPVQYEMYMNQMKEPAFEEYLQKETAVYQNMRENSLRNAIEQARRYGKRIEGVIPSLTESEGITIYG